MNVVDFIKNDKCCGCGACVAACPTDALTLACSDTDWHLRPIVDRTKCIECGKCVRICPAECEKQTEDFEPFGYASVAEDDVRLKSASGGMFYLLARWFISKGGYVCGAAYCEGMTVKHIIASDLEGVERIRGSKYVQSDASEAYRQVKCILDGGKRLLFSGTPCQVAGLKNYLGRDYPKLLCVDIVCHGVPSPKIFDTYLTENFDKKQIKDVIFRNKLHRNGHPGSLTVVLEDGREFYSEYFDNSYYDAFLANVLERDSCFDCKYCEFPRIGDISVGDFWGARTVDTKIDHERGCSIIIANSAKGKKYLKRIKGDMKSVEEYPVDTLMSWNRNKRELEAHHDRSGFTELVRENRSLRVATDMRLSRKFDVGVFGVTMNPNFGGLITYWALYEAIKDMGYSTVLVSRPINSADSRNVTHSTEFFKKHCNTTEQLEDHRLGELNARIDKFVIGSDQIWNYNLFRCWGESLYLDFVDDKRIKIAYGSSFGHAEHMLPPERKGQVSKYFKHFDHIGVREADGVGILKDGYGVDAKHVMDPVFLVDPKKYVELSNLSKVDTSKKYVGSYIIEPNDFKLAVIKKVTEHLGIANYNTTDGNRDYFAGKSQWFKDRDMHIQSEATIYDWLKIIINSEFVVTDSYHAMCFCIMFNKPFVLLQERWALSRIESLTNLLGIDGRWLKISSIEDFEIDEAWFEQLSDVGGVLKDKIGESRAWLESALSSPKPIEFIDRFIPLIDKKRVEDYFYFLMKDRKDLIVIVSSANVDKNILGAIDFKSKLSFESYHTEGSSTFAMIYDYKNDVLKQANTDISEISYSDGEHSLTVLVDNSSPKTNNVYTKLGMRRVNRLSTEAGVVISIYSRTHGRIVDSFEVEIEDGVAIVVRR